jgi:26S proteasome regulatory subunit N9
MTAMNVDAADVSSLLREARLEAPEHLQGNVIEMEDLWERRLWHQLTLELETFFKDAGSKGMRMKLFKGFVETFEKNMSQFKLVALSLLAKEELEGLTFFLFYMCSLTFLYVCS